MKYLSQINKKSVEGKTALLRLDLNIQENELKNSLRLQRSIPTILFLLERGASVVILSHRGRPKRKETALSLKKIGLAISKQIGQKVNFFGDFDFSKIKRTIKTKPSGSVLLLENLRFLPGEEKNDAGLAKQLASLGDFYVNDAFAVSHRANASVAAIAGCLPSYAGLEMESELEAFGKAMKNPKKPLVLIIGGAKIGDKVGVLNNFSEKSDRILVGGGVANTFFAAKNIPVGDSLYDSEKLALAKKWSASEKLLLPSDVVMDKNSILDIGQESIRKYADIIRKAGTVIWNGPMGYIENSRFQKGTLGIIEALGKSKAFSVVGGGETTSLILERGLSSKVSYLSIGGGAMLEYLAGKKLPGIEALK